MSLLITTVLIRIIIAFEIPKDGFTELKVYDIIGREILILINEFKTAGSYNINFNTNNLSSGIYFYELSVGDYREVKRMVLLKK
ncbi:MAG: T9SS type A sorting domain-containing protein [bacterium]|nr:T9SS type A sorting domain-containing protein [bacterium]